MMAKKKKRRISGIAVVVLAILLVMIVAGGIVGFRYYKMIYHPNIKIENKGSIFVYIPTGSNLEDVVKVLKNAEVLKNEKSFLWVAEKKNYANHVYPGRYMLIHGMNNNELVDLLRSGKQVPVNVTFNNVRLKSDLASKVSKQIEADSASIFRLLNDEKYLKKHGMDKESAMCAFIPNTYELYWNTSAEEFFARMKSEFDRYWTEDRLSKAKSLGLSRTDVCILASIVQAETAKIDERPRVAGVYINRLKRNMLLQADPTLVFALGDFTIRRVLRVHKQIDSPYNTYKHTGLPPGPINLPAISSLEAVLDHEDHNYIYFCAKEDMSGYHNFAKTHAQHLINAAKYRRALNNRNIWR